MQVLVNTKLSPHKYKTPEGYLYCQDAIIARTGKQTYMKSEVFPNSNSDELIEIDRPAEEVTSPLTLASFEDKPITCEHPDENVGPHNYNELAVGHTKNVRVGPKKIDGETVLLADLIITDEQTIEDIENGERTDLSCGYDCDITDGPNYKQINIRGNHVALCEQGRAGCARIVDSVKDDDIKENTSYSNGKYNLKILTKAGKDRLTKEDTYYVEWNGHKEILSAKGIKMTIKHNALVKDSINNIHSFNRVLFMKDVKDLLNKNPELTVTQIMFELQDKWNLYGAQFVEVKSWLKNQLSNNIVEEFGLEDSKEDDFNKLISEEEDAINSYKVAIEHAKKRDDTKTVELLTHIMEEEIEHKAELEMKAKIADWNIPKLLKDADSLNIKYKCNKQTLYDSEYSFIGSKKSINKLKELNSKKLSDIQETAINKPVIKDSVSKGTLIQEFGRNGNQYRIVKIEKNTIYAEDIISDKLTLFRKDKEGIDWAVINKSDIKDSMPNISSEADNIIKLLKEKNINADITTTYAAIIIKFEDIYDMNKIFKILENTYDCEKNKDKLEITIYDKIKSEVKDRVIKANKHITDSPRFSRKFYVKALDVLQRKLDKLEKNKTLDGFNNEYESQKNHYKQQLKTQIEKYKQEIEKIDKGEY